MSEIRVDNILSADGTAAPVYSKGINVAAGQTITNAGDFNTSGNATFSGGAQVVGVTTFLSALDNVNFTGISTFNNNVKFQEGLNVTGVVTFSDLSIQSGVTTFSGNVSVGGTLTYEDVTSIDSLGIVTARKGLKVLDGGIDVTAGGINVAAGICTFPANSTIGGSVPAHTGKAIAMAMIFGG